MKLKTYFLLIQVVFHCLNSLAQNPVIELNFTGINNFQYQVLDSILVHNQSQDCDTILYYPDTTLSIEFFADVSSHSKPVRHVLALSQNCPNPFDNFTTFELYLPYKDEISVLIYDILGNQLESFYKSLPAGIHNFTFYAGKERIYLVKAIGASGSSCIKMISGGSGRNIVSRIDYKGFALSGNTSKSGQLSGSFVFNMGDELWYIGYSNIMESGIIDTPTENSLVEFQFANNIPCPGTPTILYEGQEYNTVQIFSQCWMKESLNLETENSWCVYNDPEYCTIYGRLYLWETALGVCPPGWHLPSDDEWTILEGVSDIKHGILDPVWGQSGGWRGFDAGTNLKSTSGWFAGGNGIDLFGFSAKPGGYQMPNGNNGAATIEVGFWTSTAYENETAWQRFLQYSQVGVYSFPFEKEWGLYVRCVKD